MTTEFRTRRGRLRPIAVISISFLALGAGLFSGMPVLAKALLTAAVLLAAWRNLARHSVHAIRIDRISACSLDGVRGKLTAEAVSGLFVALKLIAPDGAIRRAFLFRDELQHEEFRALLAYLRHG